MNNECQAAVVRVSFAVPRAKGGVVNYPSTAQWGRAGKRFSVLRNLTSK